MAPNTTRRDFLKLTGAAAGAMTIGPQIVSAEAAENRFIVDTRSASSDAWRSEVEVVHDIEQIDIAVVTGEESALSGLNYQPDIEYELSVPAQRTADENDLESGAADESEIPEPSQYQWDKHYQDVHSLHEDGVTGEGARVAVIDSGVGAGHPALDSNVDKDASQNFTGDDWGAPGPYGGYHGTHVAGIIAADGSNSVNVVGTAPRATIVDCRVFSPSTLAFQSDIIRAINYAANPEGGNCDVANLSLGSYPNPKSVDTRLSEIAYQRTAEHANEQGMLVVAAAGNDDSNLTTDGDVLSLPNEADNFVSVSATGPASNPETGELVTPVTTPATYTNYGPDAVHISAEGGSYISTEGDYYYGMVFNSIAEPNFRYVDEDGDGEKEHPEEYLGPSYTYSWVAGTSMAAPQVCGAAALVYAENSGVEPGEVATHLFDTANHPDADYSDVPYFGDTNDQNFADGELEDSYSSEVYRGNGHLDVSAAATQTVMSAIEFRGETFVPRDLDGDGKYEDVNGDGVFDTQDVRLLYQLLFRPESASLTPAHQQGLDFDGDGELTQGDVQALVDLLYE